jgi:hypothetical protein
MIVVDTDEVREDGGRNLATRRLSEVLRRSRIAETRGSLEFGVMIGHAACPVGSRDAANFLHL